MIISIPSLLLLWIFRNNRNREILLKYRYKLYKLRDNIREVEAKDPEIENVIFFYEYLEFSIVKLIDNLYIISIPTLIISYISSKLSKRHSEENKKIKQLDLKLKIFLRKNKHNKKYEKLFDEYGEILVDYFIDRHLLTLFSTLESVHIIIKVKNFLVRKILSYRFKKETAAPQFIDGTVLG